MKNALFMGFIALLMISCNSKVETTKTTTVDVDKDQIRADIEAMESAYAKSFNAKDVEGVLAYYAEDAESYESGNDPLIGKAHLRTELDKQMKQIPPGMTIGFKVKDLKISNDGSQIVETGHYMVKDSTGTDVATGNFLALFEKRDGKYQCVREMITADKEEKK